MTNWHIFRLINGTVSGWITTEKGDTARDALQRAAEKEAKQYVPLIVADTPYLVLRAATTDDATIHGGLDDAYDQTGAAILVLKAPEAPALVASPAL